MSITSPAWRMLRVSVDPSKRVHALSNVRRSRSTCPAVGFAALGMSLDSFERHVQPHVRLVRRGKLRLVPVTELQRWLDESATHALD
ncbi:MAG: hypothetical protein QOD71_816 [Thermoleophilaceae bacterium]|nr:hypothetical protein [Thermoleophilaceae bacterium]